MSERAARRHSMSATLVLAVVGIASPALAVPQSGAGPPATVLSTSTYLSQYASSCSPVVGTPIARPTHVSHYIPPEWEGEIDWIRDKSPQNKIDDTIDADQTSTTFDVILAYRRPPTDADVNLVESLDPGISVDSVGRYLPYLEVSGVPMVHVATLSALPEIAFVEQEFGFTPLSDVSSQALKIAPSSAYPMMTVEENFPGIEGVGVNIVVMDSGVENEFNEVLKTVGYYTVSDPLVPPIAVVGYDFKTDSFVEPQVPEVDNPHGTYVASIALGRPWTDQNGNTARGMAKQAGLIDVRIFDNSTITTDCSNSNWGDIVQGLSRVLDRHTEYLQGLSTGWKVDVINMSFRQCDPLQPPGTACTQPSDGTEVFGQMVDLASEMGIVVVAGAGNDGCKGCLPEECFAFTVCNAIIGSPASSSRAISVGATFDKGTPDRADDDVACFSTPGPRLDDGDLDPIDELKPEVVAPGQNISAAFYLTPTIVFPGTFGASISTPHVSGLIALAKQLRPSINWASVRNLVIRTAEPGGTPSSPNDPVWNDLWGWGSVDAFAAASEASVMQADPHFTNGASQLPWLSPDLSISPFPFPKAGIVNFVTARVHNAGSVDATDVDVQFGAYRLTPTRPGFAHIGTGRISSIPVGGYADVTIPWIPKSPQHASIVAEIGFGGDADYSNNRAKLSFAAFNRAMSFPVQNLLSVSAEQIDLEVSCISVPGGSTEGWSVVLEPSSVTMGGNERPRDISLEVSPPPGTVDGRIRVDVTAKIGATLLGGMTVEGLASSEPGESLTSTVVTSASGVTGGLAVGLMDPALFAQLVMTKGSGKQGAGTGK